MRKLLLSLAMFVACGTVPPTPGPGPAPAASYADACANLAALGCQEGNLANCASRLQALDADHLTYVDVACLAGAKSPAAARSCGTVRCGR